MDLNASVGGAGSAGSVVKTNVNAGSAAAPVNGMVGDSDMEQSSVGITSAQAGRVQANISQNSTDITSAQAGVTA